MRAVLIRVAGLIAPVALAAGGAWGQPILIDFESFPGMSNAPGAVIPEASRLSSVAGTGYSVQFSSGSAFVAVVVHGPNTPSGTRLLGGSTPDGRLTYQSEHSLVMEFRDEAGSTPLVVSDVSIRGDLTSVPGTKTLEAFDVNGGLIERVTLSDSNPAPLRVTAAGIHRIRVFSSSATVGFDDLRFDTPGSATCPGSGPNACAPGDWNEDGGVDFNDLLAFLNDFNAQTPCSDVTADGVTDFNDLLEFLNRYNPGC